MATRVVSKTINLDAPIEEVSKYITEITEGGINIHPKIRGEAGSIQLDGEGTYIIDNNNKILAKYGAETIIGSEDNYHIKIIPGTESNPNLARLEFKTGIGAIVAYMSNEELNIPRVVVLDSMKVGKWMWDGKSNDSHLTLRWNGGE